MKKYIVIGLIVLVGGALLIGPLMSGNGGGKGENPTPIPPTNGVLNLPANFNFNGNPGTIYQAQSTLDISVNQKDISRLEAKLDGEVIQSWENPTSNVTLEFVPNKVGTFSLELVATLKDGKLQTDSRMIRILSDNPPKLLQASIIGEYNHDVESFTQGLEFYKNELYESSGLYGKSKIKQVNLTNGETLRKIGLDANYFGEGITILNDKIYQLTWQKGKCFTYEFKDEFIIKDEFTYVGEGWGLCNNGEELIMSNGTEFIVFRDPETFAEIRRIQVYNDRAAFGYLNELEYIDGKIYANVYQTNIVIAIDPATGRVLEQINCDELMKRGRGNGDVLNGIAQDPSGRIFMTGKNWPKLFEVKFTEVLP